MRILFDRNGIQAYVHLDDNLRLGVLLTELFSANNWISFSSGQALTSDELSEADILVITTRAALPLPWIEEMKYTPQELSDISNFVHRGGGLLLMSNHADYSGNTFDARKHDAVLAEQFGITLESTFYANPLNEKTRITVPEFKIDHPIITGSDDDKPVESIITNTFCSIFANNGDCIVSIPEEVVDIRDGSAQVGRGFAWALEGEQIKPGAKGRIVVVADSGFIGTGITTMPGPGLIGHGHNLRFVNNIIRWLGKEL